MNTTTGFAGGEFSRAFSGICVAHPVGTALEEERGYRRRLSGGMPDTDARVPVAGSQRQRIRGEKKKKMEVPGRVMHPAPVESARLRAWLSNPAEKLRERRFRTDHPAGLRRAD
jgi:hypothetical protein